MQYAVTGYWHGAKFTGTLPGELFAFDSIQFVQ